MNLTPESILKVFSSRGLIAPEILGALEKTISRNLQRTNEENSRTDESVFRRAVKEYLSSVARIAAWWVTASTDKKETKFFNSMTVERSEKFRSVINDVESGRYFIGHGIEGFPPDDGNAMRDYWSEEIEEGYKRIMSAFSMFSSPLYPTESDVFKPLYMDLMPRQLRHAKGEYYTPDWVADRVLELVGYDGDLSIRLLDPSCGSGTFLIRAAVKLRRKCRDAKLDPAQTLKLIFKNIVGFDLDYVAVETARANLLLAVADLLPHLEGKLHLPVYRADSILSEKSCGTGSPTFAKENSISADMYDAFDIVAGNPPWVNWETIPEEYRRLTKPLWERHGLFPHSGMDTILGKSKKDLSMLMTYQVMENFLAPEGVLGFVITRAALKSAGSGQGFRRFRLGDHTPIRPLHVDDMSLIKPFGSVGGSPLIIILKKGEAPTYPIPYTLWKRKSKAKASPNWSSLEDAKAQSMLIPQVAEPVDSHDETSPWITADLGTLTALRKILGPSYYTAYAGVYSGGANGVYWLRIIEKRSDGLLVVENIPDAGKRSVEPMRVKIEPDLVYPLLRAGEIERWRAMPQIAVLVVQDPETRKGIDENYLKGKFPLTWEYLHRFESLLRSRAAWRRFFAVKVGGIYRERAPFYSMFAVGKYTFAPYKVVWPRMASSLDAAVVAPINSRPVLPQETITFIPFDNEAEAHFACALLNSTPLKFAAKSYSQIGGKGFGSPHILRYLRLAKFDFSNELHRLLTSFSVEAHENALKGHEKTAADSQDELDSLAARALGLNDADLEKIKTDELASCN